MIKVIGFFHNLLPKQRRGFGMLDLLFSFTLIVIIGFVAINSILKNQTQYSYISGYEEDMFYSVKSIAKGIASTYEGDYFNVTLYNYIPVRDLDKPNSILLVDNLKQVNGNNELKNYGKRLEVIQRYKFNQINITVNKDHMLDNSDIYVSLNKSEDETFSITNISNMLLSERGKALGIGTHTTFPSDSIDRNRDEFYLVIKDKDNRGEDILIYEESFE